VALSLPCGCKITKYCAFLQIKSRQTLFKKQKKDIVLSIKLSFTLLQKLFCSGIFMVSACVLAQNRLRFGPK